MQRAKEYLYLALQGNIGLGKAIEYFTSQAIPVSIPLNDTQKYDLVVDINSKLFKVSVKTSNGRNKNGTYNVTLKNSGGSSGKSTIRPFDNTTCDYLFVYTGDDKTYLIPAEKVTATSSIVVGNKYVEYEVKSNKLSEFIHNMAG